jgi:hypothetical protein
MRFGLVSLVLACTVSLPSALAAAPPAWVPNLSTSVLASSSAADLPWLTGIGSPAPQAKTCAASRDCGDGNTATCTGTYTCSQSLDGVSCDGNDVACPHFCSASTTCSNCVPARFLTCYSTYGDCHQIDDGVSCNGRDWPCRCPD